MLADHWARVFSGVSVQILDATCHPIYKIQAAYRAQEPAEGSHVCEISTWSGSCVMSNARLSNQLRLSLGRHA